MSKKKPGYVACVLDENTSSYLKLFACHNNIRCEHVMMAFRPTVEVYNKYESLLDRELEFNITAIVADSKGQAVRVEGVPSENEHPHVTVSLNDGTPPVYSNELLGSPGRDERPLLLKGRGRIRFVCYY